MMDIDTTFRPATYFWPLRLDTYLLSSVKGAERQDHIRKLIAEGRTDEVPDWMAHESLDTETRTMIGRMHPRFMGGEYLPDLRKNEVEIARISLESVTGDVISVRARRGKHHIYYRLVDEYGSENFTKPARLSSVRPITLGQVEQLIEGSDAGMGYIKYNWENSDEVEYLHHFMRVTSPFYPDLERLYQQRVDAWLESVAPHFDEDEDDDLGLVASG